MAKGLIISVLLAMCIAASILAALLVPMAEIVGQEVMSLAIAIAMFAILVLTCLAFIFGMVLVVERGYPVPLVVEGELVFSVPPKEGNWLLVIKEEGSRMRESNHRFCSVPKAFLDDTEYRPEGRNVVRIIKGGGWKRAKIVPMSGPSSSA